MNRIEDEEQMTEEQWQAILQNDVAYNDIFFYAVKTTGIFCRPSCKSKAPNRENACVFQNAEQALAAGFRPCKRCKPTGERLPDKEWVAVMTEYIDHNYMAPLSLETLAEVCHGSPYHLHRTFKKVTGITPVDYIQQKRIAKASEYLLTTVQTVAEIAFRVGLPNTAYFITLYKKKTGYTPTQFRQLNKQKVTLASDFILEGPNHGE
ncbi:bifunctional transcriptional activator/DNA repair enzyme AdaA [Paenibacillus sp. FSL H7-0716]|uniref:AraC family transcriptional regulator n=1 Tax=Paenibacillus odorifer TaxID=189426 RepID=A0AB36J575_9BACL|nr:bifunctional transcriptional activator/DNA repair enzyme AdaA [Paenibacillus odorifer]OME11601.1 AraC family transcriptional regulator [Paenibacillus odorifer]